MKKLPFYTSVSKPYTGCNSNEQPRTFNTSKLLEITVIVFWHIVIGR
jgi:hypothetical protein